jgi:anti-sigma factor RsiW
MKPCSNRRKAIALLALDELDDPEAQELRSHVQSCEGCRHYLEEISAVTEKMAMVENNIEIEASDAFHRNVIARLRVEESAAGRKITGLLGNLLNWRVALPATATAICVVLMIGLRAHRQMPNVQPHPPTPTPSRIVSAPDVNTVVPPTIGNYQMAADQSLQKFDELLDQEAKQLPPPMPAYTASTLTLADMAQ